MVVKEAWAQGPVTHLDLHQHPHGARLAREQLPLHHELAKLGPRLRHCHRPALTSQP